MATQFFMVVEAPKDHAERIRAVSEELFDEIRQLESLLSRFIEDSEISQINRLRNGESMIVSPETFRCLDLAREAWRISRGHFDAAYLSRGVPDGEEAFELLSRPFRVVSLADSLRLDLGGIGKGFALEYVRDIPVQYGYCNVLICADTSTILALEPPHDQKGWPVQLELENGTETIELINESISCSGKTVRGEHIFDTHRRKFVAKKDRVYIRMSSAALADALSTAAMTLLSPENPWHFREGGQNLENTMTEVCAAPLANAFSFFV